MFNLSLFPLLITVHKCTVCMLPADTWKPPGRVRFASTQNKLRTKNITFHLRCCNSILGETLYIYTYILELSVKRVINGVNANQI